MAAYRRATLFLLLASLAPGVGWTQQDLLIDNPPASYTVQRGDTLWGIASRFLREPWRWPEIWRANPAVQDPHRIFPGDQLRLSANASGQPVLKVAAGERRIKLSPQVRIEAWDGSIPGVPVEAIAPFLYRPLVLDTVDDPTAGYVLALGDGRLLGGTGQRFYARNLYQRDSGKFDLIRPGAAYHDWQSGELLGFEGLHLGTAMLQRDGDPATLMVVSAEQEIGIGDRLIPAAREQNLSDFYPKPPPLATRGHIISVLNGLDQIGQYSVVVLDRGEVDDLTPGTVLRVMQRGEQVIDTVAGGMPVQLPDEPAGYVMVFRSFERVSFALVMEATRVIHLGDRVENP